MKISKLNAALLGIAIFLFAFATGFTFAIGVLYHEQQQRIIELEKTWRTSGSH